MELSTTNDIHQEPQGEGHALGYGITRFPMPAADGRSVFDKSHVPQQVIDILNENTVISNPVHRSSASIAHPTQPVYDWPWLAGHSRRTNGHRGMELMSGQQTNFSLTSPPMQAWRGEAA